MQGRYPLALGLLLSGLLLAAPAAALPIVYTIQADETDGLGGFTGNDYTLTFRYDGATADSNVDPTRGTFSGGLEFVALRRNGVLLAFPGPYLDEEIRVKSDGSGFDFFDGHIDNGSDRVSWTNEFAQGSFADPNQLPTSMGPVLLGGLSVSGSLLGQTADEHGFILSVSADPVPEPNAALAFATGLGLIGGALRRRRCRQTSQP